MIRLRLLPQDRVSLRPEEMIIPLKIEELGRITAEWPSCLRQLHLVEGVCLCERGTLDICRQFGASLTSRCDCRTGKRQTHARSEAGQIITGCFICSRCMLVG